MAGDWISGTILRYLFLCNQFGFDIVIGICRFDWGRWINRIDGIDGVTRSAVDALVLRYDLLICACRDDAAAIGAASVSPVGDGCCAAVPVRTAMFHRIGFARIVVWMITRFAAGILGAGVIIDTTVLGYNFIVQTCRNDAAAICTIAVCPVADLNCTIIAVLSAIPDGIFFTGTFVKMISRLAFGKYTSRIVAIAIGPSVQFGTVISVHTAIRNGIGFASGA